jgi:hypothetical protein
MSYLALADERRAIGEERAACAAIADAVADDYLLASQSPVDPIRNIGIAQVAVAKRIAEEIRQRGRE